MGRDRSLDPTQEVQDQITLIADDLFPTWVHTIVTSFNSDMTLRWACRAGDYVFWARCQGILSSPNQPFKIADIWELRDGDALTLTNRPADLPVWFDLYPTEVSGLLALWMKKRLDEGYAPKEPMEVPNIWRVFAGNRLVWVGPKRDGVHFDNGVLELVDFTENALVCGEPLYIGDHWPNFGGFDRHDMSPESMRLCQAGWNALILSGFPRVVHTDNCWAIG